MVHCAGQDGYFLAPQQVDSGGPRSGGDVIHVHGRTDCSVVLKAVAGSRPDENRGDELGGDRRTDRPKTGSKVDGIGCKSSRKGEVSVRGGEVRDIFSLKAVATWRTRRPLPPGTRALKLSVAQPWQETSSWRDPLDPVRSAPSAPQSTFQSDRTAISLDGTLPPLLALTQAVVQARRKTPWFLCPALCRRHPSTLAIYPAPIL